MKIKPEDNASNQANANKGSENTNLQYAQVHGNRGKQLNPNQHAKPLKNEDIDQGHDYSND